MFIIMADIRLKIRKNAVFHQGRVQVVPGSLSLLLWVGLEESREIWVGPGASRQVGMCVSWCVSVCLGLSACICVNWSGSRWEIMVHLNESGKLG